VRVCQFRHKPTTGFYHAFSLNSVPCPRLPVGRLPGVGKVTEEKLKHLEIQTVADLRRVDLPTLEGRFGRYGVRLYELTRGIDKSEVVPDRPTQSISAEETFEQDVLLTEMEPMILKLAEHPWAASRKESRIARTVVLKLKTSDFKILTRSQTLGSTKGYEGTSSTGERCLSKYRRPWSEY
jgi:DNA polymerase IV